MFLIYQMKLKKGNLKKNENSISILILFELKFLKRFKFLFDKRKRWNYEELSALIRDLCSNNSTEINNALTKYCRPYTQNNVKYFTSRMS